MDQRKVKVLLFGDVSGAYRSQNLIKALNDHTHTYITTHVCRSFYLDQKGRGKCLFCRLPRRLLSELFWRIEAFVKAPFADAFYLLPMNHYYFPLAYLLKVLFRKPLISEFYISLSDAMANDRKKISKRSLKSHYYKKLDIWLLTRSDKVIHLIKQELDYVAQMLGISIDYRKISILPLAVEPKQISNSVCVPSQAFRVCWWGTYIPLHGLERIFEAMVLLKKCNFAVNLTLFGVPGPDGHQYKQMVHDLELHDLVRIREDLSFANNLLEEFLTSHCDLALGIFGDSEKAKNSIANKVIDALAMRLPVLTMASTILEEFIDTDRELFTCGNNPEQIAQAIMSIAADEKERWARAKAGYERYLKTFHSSHYQRKALKIINEMSNNPKPHLNA